MTNAARSPETVFSEAIEIQSPEERRSYLDRACEGDMGLRQAVEKLITLHSQAGDFLESPAVNLDVTAFAPPLDERPGTVIGPYKLLQQIGEGGMGVVFMAEQTEPIHRTVALKIIKPGMDTRQVIARFEAERQALAMMDHPNIAKVLDAGTTNVDRSLRERESGSRSEPPTLDPGRPYFVMELVKGIAITKYCDEKQLSVRERLELFQPVCEAVQHAHQKGIIHRDLKPTNVLVAEYDGRPVPKVIDFGVAKATAQRLTERTMFTEFGQVIGTVEYMSPEQAQFNQLDIDTRSDVYSLGVLLYELLTGSTPFERQRLREAAFDEVLRIIREEDPPKPSTRLSSLALAGRVGQGVPSSLASIAANRHMEPARLSKAVQGELDWIVMKCLEKDRNRRYETATGLASDLHRYLNDEAVAACPPSALYRFGKFARRNKIPLLASAAIASALLVGAVFSTWQASRAKRAEATATAAQSEAEANLEKAIAAVDEMLTEVGQQTLADIPQMEPVRRALLEKALRFYQGLLQQGRTEPRVRLESARAYRRVSGIYSKLDKDMKAVEAARQAISMLEVLQAEFPDEPVYQAESAISYQDLAATVSGMGGLLANSGDQARGYNNKAVVILEKLTAKYPDEPRYHFALVRGYGSLARGLWGEREENKLRNRIAFADRFNLPAKPTTAVERYRLAEERYRKAIEVHRRVAARFPPAPEDREVLSNLNEELSVVLRRLGRYDEAEQALGQAIDLRRKLNADFPATARYRERLANGYYRLGELFTLAGRAQAAIQPFRQAAELQETLVTDFPQVLSYRWSLSFSLDDSADALRRSGATAEAKEQYSRSADVYRPTIDLRERAVTNSPKQRGYRTYLISSRERLGTLLVDADRLDDAVDEFIKVLSDRERCAADFGDDEMLTGAYIRDQFILALAYFDLGNKNEARAWFNKAIERMDQYDPQNAELRGYRAKAAKRLDISEPQPSEKNP